MNPERIKVNVFRQGERKCLVAEWRDPTTGKLKRKSTGETTRRNAERFAASLEKQLNDGQYESTRTLWADFRKLYTEANDRKWADSTKARISTVLDAVERIISPRLVRGIDPPAVMKFTNELSKTVAPTTVAAMLRHLKAALRWACRKQFIAKVPDIEMPAGATRPGGRAVTLEELERMLAVVPKVLEELGGGPPSGDEVDSYRETLWCLWYSGLRIGEAWKLDWTDPRNITVDLTGKFPVFVISSRANKNKKDQRPYMSPEFYKWLVRTPVSQRTGYVINPTRSGKRVGYGTLVRIVAMIGRKANIVVARDEKEGPVFASAHDLRRSAATRWAASGVSVSVLKSMMRHSSIQTTAKYYTDQEAEPIGEAIWATLNKNATPPTITEPISDNEEAAETCRKSLPL